MSAYIQEQTGGAQSDLCRLRLRARRSGMMDYQSSVCSTLLEVLDDQEVSASRIEQIISLDPPLAGLVLRSASCDKVSAHNEITLRDAVVKLGVRALRSIAVTAAARCAVESHTTQGFNPSRFAVHSTSVAFLARFLLRREMSRNGSSEIQWSPDEVYAMGILHDIAYPLLVKIDPIGFSRMALFARRNETSVAQAFSRIYGLPMYVLAADLVSSWPYNNHLLEAIKAIDSLSCGSGDAVALGCLRYADHLSAQVLNYATEDWNIGQTCPVEIIARFELSPDELAIVASALTDYLLQKEAA